MGGALGPEPPDLVVLEVGVAGPVTIHATTPVNTAAKHAAILKAAMSLLHRLALRVGLELARNPEARVKAAQTLAKTQRALRDDIKPMAQQAWRNAQPEIEHAKRRLTGFANELRDEYRKGRAGE